YGVLAGLELDAEAMAIETDAVTVLFEGKFLLAVHPDCEVVVCRTAELHLARFGHAEYSEGIRHRVVGIAQRLDEIDQDYPCRQPGGRFLGLVALPFNRSGLARQLRLEIDLLFRWVNSLESLHVLSIKRADGVPVGKKAQMLGDADGHALLF